MTTRGYQFGGAFLLGSIDPRGVTLPEMLTVEDALIAKTADEFLRREVLPRVDALECGDHNLMAKLMREAGALGLLGADVPEVYGGLGFKQTTSALISEKLNPQQSFALTHEAHTVIATLPLLYFGNHDQKSRYLPKLASGEWIGSFALSEANSGSDALAMQTKATLTADGRHYLLSGEKMWITNTAFANLFTVFAKVDGDKVTVFLVERNSPGLSFGKEEHKLGMHGTSTRRLIFEDVAVPVENALQVGKGHYAAFCALNIGRFKLEAGAVGGLKYLLSTATVYAKQRKTFGTLRDLLRVKSVGIIEEDHAKGIVKYAKPLGVVAAVTPSTNPAATPVNKAMMAIKGRNAIIIAPSPLGYDTTKLAVDYMRAELERAGAPADLVQILTSPITKEATEHLMKAVELVVVTGSQDNVRRAYSSGTPAIGVGAGNVPVIIEKTADLDAAAAKICASKIFDNSTSCSSENSLVIEDAVYDAAIAALQRAGAFVCNAAEKARIQKALWVGGKLNRHLIARDAYVLAAAFDLPEVAHLAKYFIVEESEIGRSAPFSGEKLSLVLAVYRVADFAAAKDKVREILDHQGKGHSCGIHTNTIALAQELAAELEVVRVLVNFAHTFGNGGGFDSGLNFTLSMGCGSWQKNSISENLNYKHFLNITHLVTPIKIDKPSEQELFGPLWDKIGYKEPRS